MRQSPGPPGTPGNPQEPPTPPAAPDTPIPGGPPPRSAAAASCVGGHQLSPSNGTRPAGAAGGRADATWQGRGRGGTRRRVPRHEDTQGTGTGWPWGWESWENTAWHTDTAGTVTGTRTPCGTRTWRGMRTQWIPGCGSREGTRLGVAWGHSGNQATVGTIRP